MNSLIIPAHFGDEIKTLEISQPVGMGGIYQIYVGKWYHGTIHKVRGEWIAHIHRTSEITGDDILIFMDLLDQAFGDDCSPS